MFVVEKKVCPICGTMNEYTKDPDVENYGCDTCGYFECYAFGEGGHGVGFNGIKFDWLAACKEAWKKNLDAVKKEG